jgi:hypothetical protein
MNVCDLTTPKTRKAYIDKRHVKMYNVKITQSQQALKIQKTLTAVCQLNRSFYIS